MFNMKNIALSAMAALSLGYGVVAFAQSVAPATNAPVVGADNGYYGDGYGWCNMGYGHGGRGHDGYGRGHGRRSGDRGGHWQGGSGQGYRGQGGGMLMSNEEMMNHREKLFSATSFEECKTFQATFDATRAARAQQQGVTLPTAQRGNMCDALKNRGYFR